jgi:signal transduction histidine kinase/ligand-binding sensor domain-containing protein
MVNRLNRAMVRAGFIWILAVFSVQASTNAEWFTRVWQTDDGLLNNNINAMVQGRDDYLWMVTPVSLMRFDGVNFSTFPVEDFTGSIEPHNIRNIFYSRTGVLWIIPNLGRMIGLNPDFSIVTLPKNGLPKGAPWVVAETPDGSLWLGYSSAIYRVKDGQVTQFNARDGVPADGAPSLTSDGAGNLWLIKGNQICIFGAGQFQLVTHMQGIQCMTASQTNAIWLVAHAHLFKCDANGKLQNFGEFQDTAAANAETLLEDHSGAVWIGTDGNGLFRYSNSGFERVRASHSCILSLMEDHEGNVWVGTGGGGLDRISLSAVKLEVMGNNEVLSQIQSICQDTNGTLWGATLDRMLVSRIDGTWTTVFTNAAFAGNVRCVAANPEGGIWIGTQNGKLFRLLGTNYVTFDQGSNAANGSINAMLLTDAGDLWLLRRGLLQCLHDGHIRTVDSTRRGLRFSAITEDTAGNIWVGANGVVLRFDGKNFVDESPYLSVSNHTVCCLYATPDGSVWISCGGLGLIRFKDNQVAQIGIEQGLFNNYISQMALDNDGWFWFGSDRGVFKIRKQDLEQAMANHNIRLHPIVYGRNEGLASLEAIFSTASPFVHPRAIRTQDGRVWLLMHTGIVVANSNVLPENTAPPSVLLTQIAVDGQVIASYGGLAPTQTVVNLKTLATPLNLPPGYRHLEFDFTAFHFREPENIHFRYQLVGFDNDWIDSGTERFANYSRLTSGNYQFHVEACIGDGPWSEAPAALALTVAPFFWQTWWFRLGMGFLAISVVAMIVRYISFRQLRMRLRAVEQQAAIERERGRIARDIHDDLGNRLTKIELLTGLAQRDHSAPDKTVSHIQHISSTARQATNALDEIVWAINPSNDTLPHLINYLGQFAVEFLRTASIRYRVDLPDTPPSKSVSSEVRHNLFLVVKESLNNIVRHAGATEASMVILVTDQSVTVIVEDNGRGFDDVAKNGEVNGLKNMRQRMVEIGGEFELKTIPGAGTRLSFSGPWLISK